MTAKAETALKDVTRVDREKDRYAGWNAQRFLSVSIIVVLVGLSLNGCGMLQRRADNAPANPPQTTEPTKNPSRPTDPQASQQRPRPLEEEIEKALTFSQKPLIGVIAIDQEGKIQLYHSKRAESFRAEFPLKADAIEWIDSVTIFQTSNPKLCIQYMTNLIGQLECLRYIFVP